MKVKNFSFSKSRKSVFAAIMLIFFLLPLGISANSTLNNTISEDALFDQNILFDGNKDLVEPKIDDALAAYADSVKQVDGVNYIDGKMSVQLMVLDDPTLGGKIDPITVVELGDGFYYVHTTVENSADIDMLEKEDLVLKVGADRYFGPEKMTNGISDAFSVDETDSFLPKDELMYAEVVKPTSIETRDLLGVDDLIAMDYNGSGIMVNIHDTGVDFGHTALNESMAVDDEGYPLSFEPMGRMSFTSQYSYDTWTGWYGTTGFPGEWLADTFSPRHTNATGYIDLTDYRLLFVNLPDLGRADRVQDLGITLPTSAKVGGLAGNTTGFTFGLSGIHNDGLLSLTPFIEADSDNDGVYDTLYVDYETGFCITQAFFAATEAEADAWNALAPWDFSVQIAHENNANLALSKDVWNGTDFGVLDGYNDISIGSLGNVYDMNHETDYDILTGIPGDGKTLGHIWDVGGHGTGCSGFVAAALTDYKLQENDVIPSDQLFTIGGMATEANILATAGFSDTATILGWLWACGYELDNVSGEVDYGLWDEVWAFNPESKHIANISSNSWGTSAVMDQNDIAMGFDFETMFIDYLSAPGYIDPAYQGVLFLTSTGNGGSGMGTSKQPSQSTAAVAVGASTTNWWRNSTGMYNATVQGNDQVIGWSDNGPAVNGYPKIDIVAPGAFDYSTRPVVVGDGGPYYQIFGGTSASCPVVAGGMALAYQAWNLANPGVSLSPDMAKVILKSTAKDLGYDPYMQGSGRIDVYAMVDYIEGLSGDEIIAYSYDAAYTAVDRTFYNFYYVWFGEMPPVLSQDLADTAVYGGNLFAGEVHESDLIVQGNTSALDYKAVTFETVYTAVNDSNDLNTTEFYTPFALEDCFDIAELRDADYFQLEFSIPFELGQYYRSEFGGDPPYMYISSLESGTVGDGDEAWAFWNYAYDNNNFQDLFLPTNFIQDTEDPVYIRIRDRGFTLNETGGLVHPDWDGCNFTLSVRAFKRVLDPQVEIFDLGSSDGSGNFTVNITVDLNAVPGMYEGYIIVNSSNTNEVLVPYGYSVKALVEEYNVDGWTYLSDGSLTGRPNDNGLYGCADWDWRPESGDWRFYDFALENATAANTIALELEWVNPGSELNMWIVDNDGWMLAYTDYMTAGGQYISELNAGETMQRLLLPAPNYGSPVFTVIVHATNLNPTSETVPLENFTLKVSYLNESILEFDTPELDVDSPAINGKMQYVTDELIAFNWSVVDDNPILDFANNEHDTTLSIVSGIFIEHEQLLATEDMVPNAGAIVPEYTEIVSLNEGDFVSGTLTWDDTSDFDYLLIPAGAPYDFDSDIFGAPAATGANPEHFEGLIPATGDYELVVEYYDGSLAPVNFLMEFSVLFDEVSYSSVEPGDVMSANFTELGLDEGIYAYSTSTSGWNFEHTFNGKIIYDLSAPEISDNGDLEVEGNDTITAEWDVIDLSGEGTYIVFVDGVQAETGAFSNSMPVGYDFSSSSLGEYEVSINATDLLGNMESFTTYIEVVNYDPMSTFVNFTSTADAILTFIDTIDLSVNGTMYSAYVDGEVAGEGVWGDTTMVELYGANSVTGITAEGNYSIKIMMNDGYGGSDSIEYLLTVSYNAVYGMFVNEDGSIDLTYLDLDKDPITVTVTETCTETTETTTTTTTEEEGGGVPGFAIGTLIVASLGAAALLIRKSKRS